MTELVIPAEAVEAATKALIKAWGYETTWDEGTAADVRIALEAAAPHMLAAAWDEGREADDFEVSIGMDSNPYRKATRGDD